jgi:hypothetical protein
MMDTDLGRTGRQALLDLIYELRGREKEMMSNLTATQERCTQLIQSNRAYLRLIEDIGNPANNDADDVQITVLGEIVAERHRQDEKWGPLSEKDFNLPDGTDGPGDVAYADIKKQECQLAAAKGTLTWRHILDEEAAEANAESNVYALRKELIQVAAVCVKWLEAIDRRGERT